MATFLTTTRTTSSWTISRPCEQRFSKHKSCTQTTIKFVCSMLPLMKYQNDVAALVTDVIMKSAPI